MPRKKHTRHIKIVKAFYTWHPDFKTDADGNYRVLHTGKWVAEWTIKESHNPILEHYTARCATEELAKEVIRRINEISDEFAEYKDVWVKAPIFKLARTKLLLIPQTLLLKEPKTKSES